MNLLDFGCLVFDLDDTLYLERDYVASGYLAVADWLTRELAWPGERRAAFATSCWERFQHGERTHVFDHVLPEFGLTPTESLIAQCVSCYRHHVPQVTLAPDALRLLDRLRSLEHPQLWIITDGPVATQQRKVQALQLGQWIENIIYTDAWGTPFRKPHARAYEQVMRESGCPGRTCVYVGDNPAKDFTAPHRLGWTTIRIRRERGLHAAIESDRTEIDHTRSSLDGMLSAVPQAA